MGNVSCNRRHHVRLAIDLTIEPEAEPHLESATEAREVPEVGVAAAVEEEDEDIEDPFEDDDDEPERGEEAREMSPPPRKSAASGSTSGGVKKQRRPPPDLTSASFLSEEDREKNFENIRARRPR